MPLRPPAGFIRPGFDPLKNPNAPTGVEATGGDESASVSFTPPANVGGSAISEYYAVSNPDQITASAASSPINVTGLTNGTAYTFAVWALNTYGPGPFSAASGSVSPSAPLAFFALSRDSGGTGINVINRLSLSTTGNATDFGDTVSLTAGYGAASSSTRGLYTAGGNTNTIQYITFGTTGNAVDFGDVSKTGQYLMGASNSTRAIFGQDSDANYGYVTIATTGNTTTFGTSTVPDVRAGVGISSSTRGVFCANGTVSTYGNVMEYVTIASVGNAIDFGDLAYKVGYPCSGTSSSATRGILAGGETPTAGNSNFIQYFEIATTGNASDFGDLSPLAYQGMTASSNVTAVFTQGSSSSGIINTIQYVTIASTGNASDFGDLTQDAYGGAGCSNAHGGL